MAMEGKTSSSRGLTTELQHTSVWTKSLITDEEPAAPVYQLMKVVNLDAIEVEVAFVGAAHESSGSSPYSPGAFGTGCLPKVRCDFIAVSGCEVSILHFHLQWFDIFPLHDGRFNVHSTARPAMFAIPDCLLFRVVQANKLQMPLSHAVAANLGNLF